MRLAALAWRGLLARPLRTSLAVIGVALGVAVVAATIITSAASDAALRSATADLLGTADVRLRAFDDGGFTPRTVQSLRGVPGVTAVAPVAERRLGAYTAPGESEQVFTLLVLGIDPRGRRAASATPRLVAGRAGLRRQPDRCAGCAPHGRRANGLALGDEIRLDGRQEGLPPLRIIGLMADTGFAALERGEVLVVSRATLDESFSVPAPIRYLGPGPGRRRRSARPSSASPPAWTSHSSSRRPPTPPRGWHRPRQASRTVAFLFGVVAMVVGAFLVGNTLAMTVGGADARARPAAGGRHDLAPGDRPRPAPGAGARARRQRARRPGRNRAGLRRIIGFLSSTRAALVVGLPLPPLGLLMAFGLGLAVTLAGALIPATRAARMSPLEALRPTGQSGLGLVDRMRWIVAWRRWRWRWSAILRLPAGALRDPAAAVDHRARHPARRRHRRRVRARANGAGGGPPIRVVLRCAGPAGPGQPVT